MNARTRRMAIVEPEAPAPANDRGRLWYDFQIPEQFFGGLPHVKDKVRWVRMRLPRATRVTVGIKRAWYESDILAFRKSLEGGDAA